MLHQSGQAEAPQANFSTRNDCAANLIKKKKQADMGEQSMAKTNCAKAAEARHTVTPTYGWLGSNRDFTGLLTGDAPSCKAHRPKPHGLLSFFVVLVTNIRPCRLLVVFQASDMAQKPGVHALGIQYAAAVAVSSVGAAVDMEVVLVAYPPFGSQRMLQLELIVVDTLVLAGPVALKFPNEAL